MILVGWKYGDGLTMARARISRDLLSGMILRVGGMGAFRGAQMQCWPRLQALLYVSTMANLKPGHLARHCVGGSWTKREPKASFCGMLGYSRARAVFVQHIGTAVSREEAWLTSTG
jgi:hypothetical protein